MPSFCQHSSQPPLLSQCFSWFKQFSCCFSLSYENDLSFTKQRIMWHENQFSVGKTFSPENDFREKSFFFQPNTTLV